jgi:IS30 family transposase
MIKKHWSHLSRDERQVLYVMRSQGYSFREIGKELGRSPGSLCKELKRNHNWRWRAYVGMSVYEKAAQAHTKAKERESKSRKRGKFIRGLQRIDVQQWITLKLSVEKWSLEILANKITEVFPEVKASTSTLYRFIKQRRKDLIPFLPQRGKKYRQRIADRRGVFRGSTPIAKRPSIKNKFGHYEFDTIVSSKNNFSILTGREKKSRYAILSPVSDLKAKTVKHRLHAYTKTLSGFKSITHDKGSEFASVFKIKGIKSYRSEPHCSWQRGSVENLNKLIRRFLPKDTDFSVVPEISIREIQNKINNRPLKCLGFKTPAEVFNRLVAN